jgi:hypothetical protein
MHNPQFHPCPVDGCNRGKNDPFRRKWNLSDHTRRVHKDDLQPVANGTCSLDSVSGPASDDNSNYNKKKRQREIGDNETRQLQPKRRQVQTSKRAAKNPPAREAPLSPAHTIQQRSPVQILKAPAPAVQQGPPVQALQTPTPVHHQFRRIILSMNELIRESPADYIHLPPFQDDFRRLYQVMRQISRAGDEAG